MESFLIHANTTLEQHPQLSTAINFARAHYIDALIVLGLVYTLRWLGGVYEVLKNAHGQPGYISLFQPFNFGTALFGGHWRANLQVPSNWAAKFDLHHKFNSSVLVIPSLFPPTTTILISDPEAFRITSDTKGAFNKDASLNHVLLLYYGQNLVNVNDGDEWRRQRKVIAPGFNERTNAEVWKETLRVCDIELASRIDEKVGADGMAVMEDVEEAVATVAFIVIARTAVGEHIEWPTKDGEVSPIVHAIRTVLHDFIPKIILPDIAFKVLPSKYLKGVDEGYRQFDICLRKIIADRRSGLNAQDHPDLLGALVAANEDETGKNKLSEEELVANCYLLLLAGHETSAGGIASALFFLTFYPEHQTKIFAEVSTIFDLERSLDHTPYSAHSSLPYTTAFVQEVLRIFPVSAVSAKMAYEDTVLPARTCPTDGSEPQTHQIVVPRGATIRQNIHGSHYNPAAYPDPYEFRHERFLTEEKSSDKYLAFSWGNRGCIGKNVAMTETVAFIAAVVARSHLEIPPESKAVWEARPGESESARRERIMTPDMLTALTPKHLKLAFRRREQKY